MSYSQVQEVFFIMSSSLLVLVKSPTLSRILCLSLGVTDIETNVEAKTVVVQADASVSPEFMLGKLQKWGNASGKTVELAS